jgi:hypothetical protein
MSNYENDVRYTPDNRYVLNVGRLWASGVATAVVAALATTAGFVTARGLFKVPVLAPQEDGVWGDAGTVTYSLVAALVALLATGLVHVLSLTVAEPRAFFRWIMVLVTVIGFVVPLTLSDAWGAKVATALINLIVGIVITAIVDSVAAASRVRRTRPVDNDPVPQYDPEYDG